LYDGFYSLFPVAKDKKNHTYKLPLSSPTLHPLPPLTLLQEKWWTPRWENTTKNSIQSTIACTNVHKDAHAHTHRHTVEDEWSRRQSKSNLSWDTQFWGPREGPSSQQLLCSYLLLFLSPPSLSFSHYKLFLFPPLLSLHSLTTFFLFHLLYPRNSLFSCSLFHSRLCLSVCFLFVPNEVTLGGKREREGSILPWKTVGTAFKRERKKKERAMGEEEERRE